MAQRYRLHLSDGTVFLVDHDSLSTWLVDPKATVQVEGSNLWLPLREFLAAERAAAFRATPRKTAKTREELPLVPPPPRKGETPKPPAAEPTPTPPPPREPPPSVPAPQAARPVVRPDDSMPPIPLVPLETPETPTVPLADERVRRSPAPALPPEAFAEEPPSADSSEQDLSVIPLKPIAEADRSFVPTWSEKGASSDRFEDRFDGGGTPEEGLRHADVVFLRGMAVLGEALSRMFGAVARFERRQQARRATTPRAAATAARVEGPRTESPRSAATQPSAWMKALGRRARSLAELLSAQLAKARTKSASARPGDAPTPGEPQTFGELLASVAPRPSRTDRDSLEERTDQPPPASAAFPPAALPATRPIAGPPAPSVQTPRTDLGSSLTDPPRAVPKPPPALSEIPVLRLAQIPRDDDDEPADLYEGDVPGEGPRLLPIVWLWTKRLVLLAVLGVGGVWAALTWKTWFPRAGEVGQKALTTIDQQVRAREIESQRARALQEGSAQLPQLAPDTIRLLLSRNAGGGLSVADLFQAANDAATRGRAALTEDEAREITALQAAQIGGLDPLERDRVHDYERARAVGAAFPAEERVVIDLVARGARLLPPDRLARLQELLAKSIAAGLAAPPDAAPPSSVTPSAPPLPDAASPAATPANAVSPDALPPGASPSPSPLP